MHNIILDAQFNAPVKALFDGFRKTELLVQWFAPGNIVVAQIMSSFEVDGAYRIVLQEPTGEQHLLVGRYTKISPDKLLTYTWQWATEEWESEVQLSFADVDESSSSLHLEHRNFPDEQTKDEHQQLWLACLEKLSLVSL